MQDAERIGVAKVNLIFEKIGFLFREQPVGDYGIDAIVEERISKKELSGKLIGVQIKSGASFFKEVKENKIIFRGEMKHYKYWKRYSLPVILVLYNPETNLCIYEVVSDDRIMITGKSWKIEINEKQKLENALYVLRNLNKLESEYHKRLSMLAFAKTLMELTRQEKLVVKVGEWVNKSSGRGEFIIMTIDNDGTPEKLYEKTILGFGIRPYEEVLPDVFPWADLVIDADFYDIKNNALTFVKKEKINKVSAPASKNYTKMAFKEDDKCDVYCAKDGTEAVGKKIRVKGYHTSDVIGYLEADSFQIAPHVRNITATCLYNGNGCYLTSDNYETVLPIWVAKHIPLNNWYEKDIYATTSDGGDAYTKDDNFLKACLLYTVLSNQNKCLSFLGSDGYMYQNELCLDSSKYERAKEDAKKEGKEITSGSKEEAEMMELLPVAYRDLMEYEELDDDEKEFVNLWKKILEEARATEGYDSEINYGVYQITKELNTFKEEKQGKGKKKVPAGRAGKEECRIDAFILFRRSRFQYLCRGKSGKPEKHHRRGRGREPERYRRADCQAPDSGTDVDRQPARTTQHCRCRYCEIAGREA